jgi:hypothetical protein
MAGAAGLTPLDDLGDMVRTIPIKKATKTGLSDHTVLINVEVGGTLGNGRRPATFGETGLLAEMATVALLIGTGTHQASLGQTLTSILVLGSRIQRTEDSTRVRQTTAPHLDLAVVDEFPIGRATEWVHQHLRGQTPVSVGKTICDHRLQRGTLH